MWMYRALQSFLRFLTSVFFRQIEVVGEEHVPPEGEGPVLFAGNHPNSLLDPALIVAYGGRIVRFAAKDVLFRSRALRIFLDGLGAVPVARKMDHGGDGAAVDNQQMFESLFQVLADGGAVGIFPEGISHDEASLQRLKTGAARIALGVVSRHPALPLRIVPCGLTYMRRKRFRSRVLLQFGPPILLTPDDLAAYSTDPQAAARKLTDDIDRGIRALTVNASDWETLRVLDGVRRLYQPAHISLDQRVELARRFNDTYPLIQDQPGIRSLFVQVEAYLDRLRELRLRDRDLRRAMGPLERLGRTLQHVTLMLVWMPLALPGAAIHVPLGLAASWAGRNLAPRKDVIATTKLVGGLFMALAVFGATLLTVLVLYGWPWALGAAVLLPLSALATLRVLERGAALRVAFRTLRRLFSLSDEMQSLRSERERLESQVLQAVATHLPADMVPLFPERAGAVSNTVTAAATLPPARPSGTR